MNQILCPYCQSTNRHGANYCATCGRSLSDALNGGNEETPALRRSAPADEPGSPDDIQTMPLRPSFDLHVGRRTDVGRVRQSNEDSLLALELVWSNVSIGRPAGLFVVADGMGGHEGGEIASGMLVKAIGRLAVAEWLPRLADGEEQNDHGEWLAGAIQSANGHIYDWARQAGLEMGTTIVAALLIGNQGHIAHVGDSRAYRINAAGLERLTIDHSLVESLVVANQISREEARDHPQVNVIYRTIGDKEQVEIDVSPVRLARGDALLLCSDGLTGMLTDESIHQIVSAAASPQAACDALVNAANKAGGVDNITVMIIKLESLPPAMPGQA